MRGRVLVCSPVVAVVLVAAGVLGAGSAVASTPNRATPGASVDVHGWHPGHVKRVVLAIPGQRPAKQPVFVVAETAGVISAFLGRSPHLGCRLAWVGDPHYRRFSPSSSNVAFEDPCGGSTFAIDGSWVGGPAPRALDSFPVKVVGGRARIDVHHLVTAARRPFIDAPPGCSPDNAQLDYVDPATHGLIQSKVPRWIPVDDPAPPHEFVGCISAILEFPQTAQTPPARQLLAQYPAGRPAPVYTPAGALAGYDVDGIGFVALDRALAAGSVTPADVAQTPTFGAFDIAAFRSG